VTSAAAHSSASLHRRNHANRLGELRIVTRTPLPLRLSQGERVRREAYGY
jgi:hypothetical protein